jgi:uncharacterized repeat protein (TIGR01451 family)
MLAAPEIVSIAPAPNSFAPVEVSPVIEFDQPITAESAPSGVAIFGSQRSGALYGATVDVDGKQIVIDPAGSFFAGERVRITATDRLQNAAGEALATPYVSEFTAATSPSPGTFSAAENFNPLATSFSRLGDVNGDGHLDVLLLQTFPLNSHFLNVYINDGNGRPGHAQQFNAFGVQKFSLGDLDDDGDLDIIGAAMQAGQQVQDRNNVVWLNDGAGHYEYHTNFGYAYFTDVILGDVDADGDLDAFSAAFGTMQPQDIASKLWINDGAANFSESAQTFAGIFGGPAAMGDFDGDGDLDVTTTYFQQNSNIFGARIWWNDGHGQFTDSGQHLGAKSITSMSTGDLDGDGDLDLFFSIYDQQDATPDPEEVYLNKGQGQFNKIDTAFLPSFSQSATLGDIDGDGDLDAIVVGYYDRDTDAYLNDGAGHFTLAADLIPSTELFGHVSLGDLDGDRDLDMILAGPTPVWMNKDADADVTLSISDGNTVVRVGDLVTYELTVSNAGPDEVDALPIVQTISDNLLDLSWTSVAANGATAAANGVGPVSDSPSLPAGSSVTYAITARIESSFAQSAATSASIALPGRYDDPTRQDHIVNDVNLFATDYEQGGSHFPNREVLFDAYGEFLANDVDRDGDLDFLIATGNEFIVRRNEGALGFTEILREYDPYTAHLDVGDVDHDGDVDALLSNGLWYNDGNGNFTRSSVVKFTASAVVFADLNGDGWLDAYVGGRPTQGASIWLNDGTGELWEQSQRFDAQFIDSLEAGDMDSDGDLDLVAVFHPYQQNTYTALLVNDGTGVIQYANSISQDMQLDAEVGDLDGDGDLDIVSGTGSRMIWLNDGRGNFAWNGQTFPSPSYSGQAAVADFDGDGDLDVYLGKRTFRNDGTGNFELVRELVQDDRAFVQAVDFDRDGDADLLTAYNGISIFRNFDGVSDLRVTVSETTAAVVPGENIQATLRIDNSGTDTMRAVVRLPLDTGLAAMAWTSEPSEGATSTPAGSGAIDDEIVIPAGGTIIYTILATTDPQLVASLTLRASVTVGEESPQRYADPSPFNNQDSDTAAVQLTPVTKPGGQFFDSAQRLGDAGMPSVALGDLDGDGDVDALAVETNQGARVWRNNGNGYFSAAAEFFAASRVLMAKVADLDGDHDLDAMLVGLGNVNSIWINDGSGSFAQRAAQLPAAQSVAVALGDLDGDFDVDAYVVNTDGQPDHVYWNDGQASFVDSGLRLGAESGLTGQLGDMDGDGDLDAVVANIGARGAEVWKNNGANGFARESTSFSNEVAGRLAIGDLDNDGDLDFVIPDRLGIALAYNQGRGSFFSMTRPIPGQQQAVALADLDGNGALDIFVAKGGPISGEPDTIFFNQGNGNFVRDPQDLGNSAGLDVALADLDGDGDTDAFVANGRLHTGESSEVWRNGQQQGDTFPFDGVVDLSDLNRVRNNFGATGAAVEGDANGDGSVDLADLNLVRNNFGAGAVPQSPTLQNSLLNPTSPWKSLVVLDVLFERLSANDLTQSKPRKGKIVRA